MTDCWLFAGRIGNKGYGIIFDGQKNRVAGFRRKRAEAKRAAGIE